MEEGVEGIPSGLISCFLGEKAVAIIKIATRSLTLRLEEAFEGQPRLSLKFYHFASGSYEQVVVEHYEKKSMEKHPFWIVVKLEIHQETYEKQVKRVLQDYNRYVLLKNQGEENEFSQKMVGYPAQKDNEFYSFYSEQKRDWMLEIDHPEESLKELEQVEFAITLNQEWLYQLYLKQPIKEYMRHYLRENHALHIGILQQKISRLYIGSEYCHLLGPSEEMLFKLLEKAKQEGLEVTLCFTYMRECYIDKMTELMVHLKAWCDENQRTLEIVINDWGMLKLIEGKTDVLKPILGTLLNKRSKDPRYVYKQGYAQNKERLAKNSLNQPAYQVLLKQYGIKRYEYEACGYQMEIPSEGHSLHFPFYVTNISQYCPLHAMCAHLQRGHQSFVTQCPQYCKDYIFAYPKHLKMVGRFNALFAFDDTLLKDNRYLVKYVHQGIDRLVLNFI